MDGPAQWANANTRLLPMEKHGHARAARIIMPMMPP